MTTCQITTKEYLENALCERPGTSDRVNRYNKPRNCIKHFFPDRSCFVLPRPVDDEVKLRYVEENVNINNTIFFYTFSMLLCWLHKNYL